MKFPFTFRSIGWLTCVLGLMGLSIVAAADAAAGLELTGSVLMEGEPMTSTTIVITHSLTGESVNSVTDEDGEYSVNLDTLEVDDGDILFVDALSPSGDGSRLKGSCVVRDDGAGATMTVDLQVTTNSYTIGEASWRNHDRDPPANYESYIVDAHLYDEESNVVHKSSGGEDHMDISIRYYGHDDWSFGENECNRGVWVMVNIEYSSLSQLTGEFDGEETFPGDIDPPLYERLYRCNSAQPDSYHLDPFLTIRIDRPTTQIGLPVPDSAHDIEVTIKTRVQYVEWDGDSQSWVPTGDDSVKRANLCGSPPGDACIKTLNIDWLTRRI